MDILAGLFLFAVVAAAFFALRKGDSSPSKRTDILYGYYGCFGEQVKEVADHTSLHWETFWSGDEQAIDDIRAANKFTVLDVGRIFDRVGPKNVKLSIAGEVRLKVLFDSLREAGVLSLVKMITPIDEPNLPENQASPYLPAACEMIRRVAAEYPELSSVLLACIYYSKTPKEHTHLFDVVGYDDYDRGAEILAPDGDYERFRASLQPGQRTLLVPGGSYGQDPKPFIEYAHRHPEVFAVVPFLWWYPPHGEGLTGIRELPVRAAYEAAGLALKG